MNTQPSTRDGSDDQHWMFSTCAVPCCVMCIRLFLCILPAHANNLTCCHFSMAASLSLASASSCDISPATRTFHGRDYPFPPLCKAFSHSLLPMPVTEQKIRMSPHPAQAPAALGSHSPPTFHPDSED